MRLFLCGVVVLASALFSASAYQWKVVELGGQTAADGT